MTLPLCSMILITKTIRIMEERNCQMTNVIRITHMTCHRSSDDSHLMSDAVIVKFDVVASSCCQLEYFDDSKLQVLLP